MERYRNMVELVENFSDKDRYELMVLRRDGSVLLTSSGFAYPDELYRDDFIAAQSSDSGYGSHIGDSPAGEHIISATQMPRL